MIFNARLPIKIFSYILFLLFIFTIDAHANLHHGLIGWWKFDEGAGEGGDCTAFGTYFSGSIDDVRIYNRALSAQEALDLYNIGVQVKNAQIQNAVLNR